MWHDDVACVAFVFAVRRYVRARVPLGYKPSTLWFCEHALVNAMIATCTLPAVWAAWRAPMSTLTPTGTPADSALPMRMAAWLHAYHVAFYALTWQDVLHHGLFVTLLALPGCAYEWGALGNAQLFFLCGLPGGLVYALLAAQRLGHCPRVREPVVSALLNALVRAPGTLACTLTLATGLRRGLWPGDAPAWAVALQLTLAPANAVYYAWQSVDRARKK